MARPTRGDDPANRADRDIFDKLSSAAVALAALIVPVVVAVVGHRYTQAISESQDRVKYTELAIGILKETPNEDALGIRSWGIEMLNRYSGVAMTDEAKSELLTQPLVDWREAADGGYVQPEIRNGERDVRVRLAILSANDREYVLDADLQIASGVMGNADEQWYDGHSSVAPSGGIVAVNVDGQPGRVDVEVAEFSMDGREVVRCDYRFDVMQSRFSFTYRSNDVTKLIPDKPYSCGPLRVGEKEVQVVATTS